MHLLKDFLIINYIINKVMIIIFIVTVRNIELRLFHFFCHLDCSFVTLDCSSYISTRIVLIYFDDDLRSRRYDSEASMNQRQRLSNDLEMIKCIVLKLHDI